MSSAVPKWSRAFVAQVLREAEAWALKEAGVEVVGQLQDFRYHDAAAVLAWFEINPTLQPIGRVLGAEQAALERLVTDSICWYEQDGRRRWTLKNDVRKEVLARLATRDAMRAALAANPSRPVDVLQQALESYVGGSPKPLDEQNRDELAATLQIVDWLESTELSDALPTGEDVRRRIEFATLLEPFRALVGDHFRGRTKELAVLREYVGVLEAQSAAANIRRGLRGLFSLKEKPPLLIYGPGGMGKSTLLAKFILDHARAGPQQLPFAYLDFDRPGLVAEEPLTLLLETVRQLGIQFPAFASICRNWIESWQREVSRELSPAPDARVVGVPGGAAQAPEARSIKDRSGFLSGFRYLITDMQLHDRTLLLVLDTFEEVQYRSRDSVRELWRFLDELQSSVPRLRTVIAGRARISEFKTEDLPLSSLDLEAAQGFLRANGVTDEDLARTVADQMRGNPLSLKLAAQVLRLEGAGKEGVKDIQTARLWSRLDESLIQGQLYKRILAHVRDEDVRRLAHPGLVLRRITPTLIHEVLAEPCAVDISEAGRAEKLFYALQREVSLVTSGQSGAIAGEPEVRHRPDVRRAMLRLLQRDKEKQPQIREIHERAIHFYESQSGAASRAEEIYHRLMLGQDAATLDARWSPQVEEYLRSAIEEVTGPAQSYLASRLGMELDEAAWDAAGVEAWERYAERRAQDLLRHNRPEEAVALLQRRSGRTQGSPLYLLEARALEQLGRAREARQVALEGIAQLGQSTESPLLDLHIVAANADEVLQDDFEPADVIREFGSLAAAFPGDLRLLSLGLQRLRLLSRPDSPQREQAEQATMALRQYMVDMIASAPVDVINGAPGVFDRFLVELGVDDSALREKLLRLAPTLGAGPSSTVKSEFADRDLPIGVSSLSAGMTAHQIKRLEHVLVTSLGSYSELAQLVQQHLGAHLADVAPPGSYEATVRAVVRWAQSHGRVPDLLRAAVSLEKSAELSRLAQEVGLIEYQPPNPYDTLFVRGALPFIDRERLRAFLKGLSDPLAPNVLAVMGPPGSGKSYSLTLIAYLAEATRQYEYVAVELSPAEAAEWTSDRLIREIATPAGWVSSLGTIPGRGDSTLVRHHRELCFWLDAQARLSNRPWLIALDGFDASTVPSELGDFVRALAAFVARASRLRLILLGASEAMISASANTRVEKEVLAPFSLGDIARYLEAVASQVGTALSPQDGNALLSVLADVEVQRGKLGLNEQISKVTRAMLEMGFRGHAEQPGAVGVNVRTATSDGR